MLTDLEMTKLCAEAMGLTVLEPPIGNAVEVAESDGGGVYDPLTNDAQAMALVKKFALYLTWSATKGGWRAEQHYTKHGPSKARNMDLNRAIVGCIATMQQQRATQAA